MSRSARYSRAVTLDDMNRDPGNSRPRALLFHQAHPSFGTRAPQHDDFARGSETLPIDKPISAWRIILGQDESLPSCWRQSRRDTVA
jgi:hypothetical protein